MGTQKETIDQVPITKESFLEIGFWLLIISVRSRTDEREEGGDDVKSAWPFDALGDTRATMAGIKGCQVARWS